VPAAIPVRVRPPLDEKLSRQAQSLRRRHGEVLSEPEALARLLCGVTSPRLTKARLTSHSLFGAAAHVSFPDILAALREA
jgi:ATP-dependent DNA helicase RecQ